MKRKAMVCLALLLCFALVMPVFAQDFPGTEESEATAVLTKVFRMSESIDTPDVTFTFEITPVSVNGEAFANGNMPEIPSKTIPYTSSDKGTVVDGVKQVSKESSSLFDGVKWPHAGIYEYTLSEKNSITGTIDPDDEIDYSEASYKLQVFVANGTNGLYVAAIGAEIIVTDGESGGEPGNKVDGTPGDPTVEGDYSKLVFTNTFTKSSGSENPNDPNLVISKHVETKEAGSHDLANRQKYFDFSVTLTKSSINKNENQKYVAYVLDEENKVVTSSDNYSGTIYEHDDYGKYILFGTGETKTVSLKHGEWLSFVDLEVDASYEVTEAGSPNFEPNVKLVKNSAASSLSAANGQSLTVPKTYITTGDDRAEFTNVFVPLTPVGISFDNLPFVIVVGLALGGLILLLTMKKRKNEEEVEKAQG